MLFSRMLALFLLLVGTTHARAESLVLLTENLPPFNMAVSGGNFARDDGISGISSETMRLVCQRAAVECQQILRFPWERVYNQALKDAGYGLFSVARTAEREDLFKWVGPIASEDWVLLARGDSPIQLSSLDQAKQYRLGGYKGDAPSEKVLTFGRGDLYLALNKQTPDATADKLRTALEQLRSEGQLQAIAQKY